MDKLNSKCRTCLNGSSKGLQALTKLASDDDDEPQKSYAQLLNELANINVMNDTSSKLPKFICSCCSRKLKAAHTFVQQARDANEKLYLLLMQPKDSDECKQLDCLQETQIDINSCLKIKMECEDSDDSMEEDTTKEIKLLGKSIQLKDEVIEEDALATNNQLETDILSSNCLRISLDASVDKFDIKEGQLNKTGDRSQDNSQESKEAFDDDSLKDISSTLTSENDELPEEIKLSSKKTRKKKTSPIKNAKKLRSSSKEDPKCNGDDDELLPAKCDDCDKVFANSRLLNRHRRGTHVPDELKIQCLYCEAKFSRRHNMYAHVRQIHKAENMEKHQLPSKKLSANKEYPCKECPRSYTNKYKLREHVNRHHNPENGNAKIDKSLQPKKRFLCALCGLTFDNQSNLNIHFRRHTGEKPYKCDFCDRAYHRLYDVQVHRRSHTGEKPYQCNICEKAFRRSNKLKIHMRTHTNERPYKCTQCEKAFKQSKDLNIHKRTHTGERPYKCTVCQSTFTQSNSLRLHQIKQKHFETPILVGNVTNEDGIVCIPSDLKY